MEDAVFPLLPESSSDSAFIVKRRRPAKVFVTAFAATVFLLTLGLIGNYLQQPIQSSETKQALPSSLTKETKPPRGVAEGVSSKSNPPYLFQELWYNWTNNMFAWQRTGFHFQPQKNWMNDPDGPLFHKGLYHLFYQYNPDNATWGLISWGHAISTDMIHWYYLPLAMVPDQWYDINGVWTGSATLLSDGQIIMLYTGDTNASVQVQNLAFPANLSDPLLLEWVKYSDNPVMVPPAGIESNEFRDPSTAWVFEDTWYLTIGSRSEVNGEEAGIALLYSTKDFKTYEKVDGLLHEVAGTGMWECIDFYPVAINGQEGVDTSAYGPGLKHVLKASLDDTKKDHYAIGIYDPATKKWRPDNPEEDVGIGLRYDYGWYYASKTFFDQETKRRILWGWINETDTETDDLQKGWASVQAIPRTVLFDSKTGSNVLLWPVDEIESLRLNSSVFEDVLVEPGSVVPLDIGVATQLDIFAEFEIDLSSNATVEDYDCSGGAAERSSLGPFGLLVLADESLIELTPIYFRPVNPSDGNLTTYFCADETRSSQANDVLKVVYGTSVPVLDDENMSLRVLVDHSIVESFAQGGRRVISSRIYPTRAIYGNARLFLFNNATGANVTAKVTVWRLDSAFISPYPFA